LPSNWVAHQASADTFSNDGSYGLVESDFGHFPGVVAFDGIRWVAGGGVNAVIESFKQITAAPMEAGVRYLATAYIHRDTGTTGFARPEPATYSITLIDDIDPTEIALIGSFDPPASGDTWEAREFSFVAPALSAGGNFTGVLMTPVSTNGYPGLDLLSLQQASDCP
jgi:hypothetical protein